MYVNCNYSPLVVTPSYTSGVIHNVQTHPPKPIYTRALSGLLSSTIPTTIPNIYTYIILSMKVDRLNSSVAYSLQRLGSFI